MPVPSRAARTGHTNGPDRPAAAADPAGAW
jgi:hypothetical protein